VNKKPSVALTSNELQIIFVLFCNNDRHVISRIAAIANPISAVAMCKQYKNLNVFRCFFPIVRGNQKNNYYCKQYQRNRDDWINNAIPGFIAFPAPGLLAIVFVQLLLRINLFFVFNDCFSEIAWQCCNRKQPKRLIIATIIQTKESEQKIRVFFLWRLLLDMNQSCTILFPALTRQQCCRLARQLSLQKSILIRLQNWMNLRNFGNNTKQKPKAKFGLSKSLWIAFMDS